MTGKEIKRIKKDVIIDNLNRLGILLTAIGSPW